MREWLIRTKGVFGTTYMALAGSSEHARQIIRRMRAEGIYAYATPTKTGEYYACPICGGVGCKVCGNGLVDEATATPQEVERVQLALERGRWYE